MKFVESLKQLVKSKLSLQQSRYLSHLYYSRLCGDDLTKLATVYRTDKWGNHSYAQHYQTHFASRRHQPLKILEIGIGGYRDPRQGGCSLRMWRTYFPNSNVYGLDIYDKTYHSEPRIKIFQGSQIDPNFLESIIAEIGEPDIIIDDGSHMNEHVIYTFEHLFPKLKLGGIYVVEDTQTSYWSKFGGNPYNLQDDNTSMGYLKKLTDAINYKEFRADDHEPDYFEKHIVSMHFYHNLVFLYKGINDEITQRKSVLGSHVTVAC